MSEHVKEQRDGKDRRESDQRDHDAVVKLSTHMSQLCKIVDEIRSDIKEQKVICSCRMENCNRFFVQSRVFYAAVSIVVMVVTTLGTVVYQNKERVSLNQQLIVHEQEAVRERLGNVEGRVFDLEEYITAPFKTK